MFDVMFITILQRQILAQQYVSHLPWGFYQCIRDSNKNQSNKCSFMCSGKWLDDMQKMEKEIFFLSKRRSDLISSLHSYQLHILATVSTLGITLLYIAKRLPLLLFKLIFHAFTLWLRAALSLIRVAESCLAYSGLWFESLSYPLSKRSISSAFKTSIPPHSKMCVMCKLLVWQPVVIF